MIELNTAKQIGKHVEGHVQSHVHITYCGVVKVTHCGKSEYVPDGSVSICKDSEYIQILVP